MPRLKSLKVLGLSMPAIVHMSQRRTTKTVGSKTLHFSPSDCKHHRSDECSSQGPRSGCCACPTRPLNQLSFSSSNHQLLKTLFFWFFTYLNVELAFVFWECFFQIAVKKYIVSYNRHRLWSLGPPVCSSHH